MTRTRILLAVCACALMAVPTIADARAGKRGFERTYPHAARLCAKVADGKTPKKLADSSAKVADACAKLQASLTAAQSDYTAAVGPLKDQAKAAVAAMRATCKQARADKDQAACKQARQDTRTTVKGLRAKVREAGKAYHEAVDAARRTFWATIKGLRGGASQPADAQVGPGPATTLASA
jgi:hypothetical protein